VTTAAPLDDVSFLVRSAHRVTVLQTLSAGARSRRDLHETTAIPQPTLGRVLGAFETRGWVERRGREYACTAFGELLCESLRGLLEAVGVCQRLGDVLSRLPADEVDVDLRAFADATVWEPEPGDALAHVRRMEEAWFAADRTRLVGSTLGPASFAERREVAETFVERGQRSETVVSRAMMEHGLSDPVINEMARDLLGDDRVSASLYDGPIPVVLAVADGTAMLAPTDDNGIPTTVVVSDDEDVRAWVDARIDHYRERATEMTVEDVPEL
jgi:predicted transcriptional regulator